MNMENTVITVQDLEGARELGRLSGEVRVLKWGAAIVMTMLFAYLTYLSQQINDVRIDLRQRYGDLSRQITDVRGDLRQRDSHLTRQINDVRSELRQRDSVFQQQFNALQQQLNGLQQQLSRFTVTDIEFSNGQPDK